MTGKIIQIFRDSAFEPEALSALGEAYDLACQELPATIDRELIARKILSAAHSGERNPVKLFEIAVQALTDTGCYRQQA